MVVTQAPPDRRVDTASDDGTDDAVVSADGRTHACTRPPDGEWTCEDLGRTPAEGVFDPDAVVDFVDALTAAAPDHAFAVEDDEVAGTDVRCLVTRVRATDEVDGRLCIAASGAILLVERPAGTLRASEYTTDVPDDAFDLPA